MGIGPYYYISRQDYTLLRQQAVLDTHPANFKIVGQPLFPGKVAQHLGLLGRFNVLVGSEMVRDQDNLFPVKHFPDSDFLKFLDSYGSRYVISQDNINLTVDQFSGLNLLPARVGSQDLFRDGHPHLTSPLLLV